MIESLKKKARIHSTLQKEGQLKPLPHTWLIIIIIIKLQCCEYSQIKKKKPL